MPDSPMPPITHLPGTAIALGLESGRRSGWWRLGRVLVMIGWVLGVVAGLLLVWIAINVIRGRASAATLGPALVGAWIFGCYLVSWIKQRTVRVPRVPDRSARVSVVGSKALLRPLLTAPPLPPPDEAFEPVVIRIGPPWYTHGVALLVAITVVPVSIGTGALGGPSPVWLLPMAVVAGLVLVIPLLKHAFTRYARFVPGRLDILRGSFLGSRLRLRGSYDLRTPTVLVDLNTRALLLISPDGSTQSVPLPTAESWPTLIPEILRAAVCTAPAAPLPDDALVG